MLRRHDFEVLDQGDSLACFRDQYELPKEVIYMVGNSLGVMPKAITKRMQAVLQAEWAEHLVSSWNTHQWFDLPFTVGDKIAQLIGADAGELVVTDSVSVNIFKLAQAALEIQKGSNKPRTKIISEKANFPTDVYVLQGLVSMLQGKIELVTVEREALADAIDDSTALVLLTDVHYKTGHLLDKQKITDIAHANDALVIWDLCHSAGALPVNLNEINADMAVGCGYKYLSGGPGAPAFVFVAKRWHAQLQQPLSGWWGHQRPFEFIDQFEPAQGIGRMLCGTQGVLGLAALDAAVDVFLQVDMQLVREKSCKMGDLFLQLISQECVEYGFDVCSPLESSKRGSQIALAHPSGYQIMRALIDKKVMGDFRAPNILRFGITPLTLRYVDIWDAVETLTQIMQSRLWDQPEYQHRPAVT